MCDIDFDRVLFYYAEWQDSYQQEMRLSIGEIEFREGLPQPGDYSNDNEKKKLIVLDDLICESSSDIVLDLFTKGSHHKNISVIFITQNIYYKGKAQRDISLNTKYLILFKNPRDRFIQKTRDFYEKSIWTLRVTVTNICFLTSLKTHLTSLDFAHPFPDDSLHYAYVPKFFKAR